MAELQLGIPYPEPKAFGKETSDIDIRTIGEIAPYEFDRAEYPETGGILTYKKGLLYPSKGFVFPQAIQCINVAKRQLIDAVVFLMKHKILIGLLLILPFKMKIKLFNDVLDIFNRAMSKVINPIAPLKQYQIDIAQELWGIVQVFFTELGIGKENAEQFARIFATCINYDNAYHLRLIDLFSETDKGKMMENPSREFKKLVAVSFEREVDKVNQPWKVKYISLLLRIVFFSPRVKGAFRKAIGQCDFKRMQYDVIWRYNVLERGDYNFMGLTYEDRITIFRILHNWQLPRRMI